MSSAVNLSVPVSELDADTRAAFIAKTYMHLLGAIIAFVGLEIIYFQTGFAQSVAAAMGGNWLLVLGAFMVVSWIATHFGSNSPSLGVQYAGLALYVVAQSLIFIPLLYIANHFAEGVIASAAVITLVGFGILTAIVMFTRKDFSFMRGALCFIGIAALVLIVCSLIFNFPLGIWFSAGMIVFAGAAILYDTSNVLHRTPEDRYVGAALHLFASVALLFWYVLRLLIALSGRD